MINFETLSRRQQKFLPIFLESKSVAEAATRSGIPTGTIYRWLSNPLFAKAYREARHKLMDEAIHRLSSLADSAVEALDDILHSSNASDQSRVSAARLILDSMSKIIEFENVQKRIEELEARLAIYEQEYGKSAKKSFYPYPAAASNGEI